MTCVSFETNLICVFQLTTNQMGLLIKLEKILSSLVKMANDLVKWTSYCATK
jgi:hypothetical protein